MPHISGTRERTIARQSEPLREFFSRIQPGYSYSPAETGPAEQQRLVGVTWNFFCFFSTSFHNIFLLQELQSTTTFVVVAGMFGNFIRLACSAPGGKYADHNGFARSMGLGFALAALTVYVYTVVARRKRID